MFLLKCLLVIYMEFRSFYCLNNTSTSNGTTVTYVSRNTTFGQIIGKLVQTEKFTAEVFLGVPYAESPTNELRFKYPVEPTAWTKQKICTEFRPYCVQFIASNVEESEDCLYLNIFVPYKTKPKSLLYPVLVWIHGGSFIGDGANMFPIDGTVNNIVAENVVVVFINYRIGPFGFLSTANESLPGNYGLEDQLLALKWVKNNIRHFDGNASEVTLAGESAGAASASLLAISPKAKGLFRHLMLRSGSSLTPWALNVERTKINSEFILSKLDCPVDQLLLNCLQNRTVGRVKTAWHALIRDVNLMFDSNRRTARRFTLNHVALTFLTPIVDNYRDNDSLLPEHPVNLLPKSASTPLLIGTTTAECLLQLHSVCVLWTLVGSLQSALRKMDEGETELEFDMSPKHSVEFPYLDGSNQSSIDWEALVPDSLFQNPKLVYQAIEMKYMKNSKSINKTEKLKSITKVMSDLMLVAPVLFEADFYAKNGMPVYLYQFDHRHALFSSKLPDCDGTAEYREAINWFYGHLRLSQQVKFYGRLPLNQFAASGRNDDVQHGLDIALLYQSANVIGVDLDNINWTSDDIAITNILSQHVTRYVKSGNPNYFNSNGQRLLWLRYSNLNPVSLIIEAEIQRLVEIDHSMFDFWRETIPIIEQLKDCVV